MFQPLTLAEMDINKIELLDDGRSMTVLENLIFPQTERSYNELDQKTAERVLRALEKGKAKLKTCCKSFEPKENAFFYRNSRSSFPSKV